MAFRRKRGCRLRSAVVFEARGPSAHSGCLHLLEGRDEMSGNQFDIYARWGVREDPPERLGQRMLRSLDALPKLNPLFEHWWMTDHSLTLDDLQNLEPGQGGFPLDEVRSRMAEIVERGVKKADDGDPTPLLGYGMSALNSPISSSKSVCLMVSGGDSVNE